MPPMAVRTASNRACSGKSRLNAAINSSRIRVVCMIVPGGTTPSVWQRWPAISSGVTIRTALPRMRNRNGRAGVVDEPDRDVMRRGLAAPDPPNVLVEPAASGVARGKFVDRAADREVDGVQ